MSNFKVSHVSESEVFKKVLHLTLLAKRPRCGHLPVKQPPIFAAKPKNLSKIQFQAMVNYAMKTK